jgi:hypothetical protein
MKTLSDARTLLTSIMRRLLVTAGLLAGLAGLHPAHAQQNATSANNETACIRSAADYAAAFTSCQPIKCVGDNLYGVIHGGTPAQQIDIYSPNYYWAWVSGHQNLDRYAAWQAEACQGKITGSTVTKNILLYVGYGPSEITPNAPYTLSVMDLSSQPTLAVPSFENWFALFQSTFHLVIPLAIQKDVILHLDDRPGQKTVPLDPTVQFSDLTGCSLQSAMACSDQPLSACSASYSSVASVLKSHSPSEGTGTTAECISAFRQQSQQAGKLDAAGVRALLSYCQGVNPCNTGLGLGYNDAFPAPGGSAASHFTGTEYVLRNQPLSSVGAAFVALQPVE